MRLCLVLIVVCAAHAVPGPCESPKQWVGMRVSLDRYKEYAEIASHSYDEVNLRTRNIEVRVQGTENDYYDVLHLHNERMEYRLNLKTKQCNVTKTTRPFLRIGVPQDAHFVFEAKFGAAGIPGEHLTAALFDGTFDDGARFALMVTQPDCIPMAFDVQGNSTDELYSERYFDVKLGIDDPSVFIPPSECS